MFGLEDELHAIRGQLQIQQRRVEHLDAEVDRLRAQLQRLREWTKEALYEQASEFGPILCQHGIENQHYSTPGVGSSCPKVCECGHGCAEHLYVSDRPWNAPGLKFVVCIEKDCECSGFVERTVKEPA